MTETSSPKAARASSRFWRRMVIAAAVVATLAAILASQVYLTRSFSAAQLPDARLRATLYAGGIQGAMERHAVVPLLLARDPVLMQALRSGRPVNAEERLESFRADTGLGSIFLIDSEGLVTASSGDVERGAYEGDKPYFTQAVGGDGTGLSIVEAPDGTSSFNYSRKIEHEGEFLGVVVVTVDLSKFEEGWRRSRVRVAVSNSEDEILLASEPSWRGSELPNVLAPAPDPSAVERTLRAARDRIEGAPFVYIAGSPYLSAEVPVGFRNWKLSFFATIEDVRARVNAILALMIMSLALLTAAALYILSRRTRAESLRIQTESRELRLLNRRLSAEIATRQKVERNLKDAEQSLEQASKLAALGQMSAAVSHELNQPLAAMKTYLAGARLLVQRKRPEEALSSFQRIDDLIGRMGGITRQLKSYARKGDVDLEPVDLRDSVRAALAMMAPQLGRMEVDIASTLPSEPVVIEADPLRIEQILVNLLRNGLDAVKAVDDPTIKILLAKGDMILLSVEDNGPGLREPGKLFEPFYTTKKPGDGLGLGLAISAGFAAEMGGRLVARNGPHGGAVFELILPVTGETLQAAE